MAYKTKEQIKCPRCTKYIEEGNLFRHIQFAHIEREKFQEFGAKRHRIKKRVINKSIW